MPFCHFIFKREETCHRKLLCVKTVPTTETEIKSIIYSPKAKNSSGYGGITSRILNLSALPICCPLTCICKKNSMV
jgi:hypothetical protein